MSWRTVSLGDLLDSFSVRAKDHVADTSSLEFCGVSNEDGITKSKYAAEEKAEDYKIIEKDCFAYNPYRINVGSIGLLEEDIVGLISPAYVVFKPKPRSIIPQLLLKFLKSSEGLRQIKLYARGTVRQALRFDDLCKIELALPNYDEQLELFKKIEESEIESSILADELTHQLDLVKQLRQAFLREAMQGKLVPQHPNDPPATVLLQHIKAEKDQLIKVGELKKQKPLPPIAPVEIPFETPKHWVWCRLGEIVHFFNGKAHEQSVSEFGEFKLVTSKFVSTNGTIYRMVKERMTPLNSNDIAFVMSDVPNGIALARTYVIEDDTSYTLNQRIGGLRTFFGVDPNWLSAIVNRNQYFLEIDDGKKQTNLRKDQILECPICLPPFSEQQRIMAKLDKLMQVCDWLEASIRQSQEQNTQLLQHVLREALEPKSAILS